MRLSDQTGAGLDAQSANDKLHVPQSGSRAQIAGSTALHGWFVFAPDDTPDRFPADLVVVLKIAKAQAAEYALSIAMPFHIRTSRCSTVPATAGQTWLLSENFRKGNQKNTFLLKQNRAFYELQTPNNIVPVTPNHAARSSCRTAEQLRLLCSEISEARPQF